MCWRERNEAGKLETKGIQFPKRPKMVEILGCYGKGGDPSRTRTCNHRLRRSVLYPVELWGRGRFSASRPAGARRRSCRHSRSAAGCAGAASARTPRRRSHSDRRRRPPPRASGKRRRTWEFMSPEPVQPISGSIHLASAGTNSSTQSRVFAWPDCMALRPAGRSSRAWRPPPKDESCPLIAKTRARIKSVGARGGCEQRVVVRLRGSEGWGGCTHPDDDHFAACTIFLPRIRPTHARV